MKINDKRFEGKAIPFRDVEGGDFFIFENNLYMCLLNGNYAYNFNKGIEREIFYETIVNPVEIEINILKNL